MYDMLKPLTARVPLLMVAHASHEPVAALALEYLVLVTSPWPQVLSQCRQKPLLPYDAVTNALTSFALPTRQLAVLLLSRAGTCFWIWRFECEGAHRPVSGSAGPGCAALGHDARVRPGVAAHSGAGRLGGHADRGSQGGVDPCVARASGRCAVVCAVPPGPARDSAASWRAGCGLARARRGRGHGVLSGLLAARGRRRRRAGGGQRGACCSWRAVCAVCITRVRAGRCALSSPQASPPGGTSTRRRAWWRRRHSCSSRPPPGPRLPRRKPLAMPHVASVCVCLTRQCRR